MKHKFREKYFTTVKEVDRRVSETKLAILDFFFHSSSRCNHRRKKAILKINDLRNEH